MITELKPNEIFVFGSNLNGWHAGGAARQAKEQFGGVEGVAIGLQGNSYAIPTLDMEMQKIPLIEINDYLTTLAEYAAEHPELEFLLTPIGTGIAGYYLREIKSILPVFPSNVTRVGDWEE